MTSDPPVARLEDTSGWIHAIYANSPYWSAIEPDVDVLLVEDDALDALLVREAMATRGHTPSVAVATDGRHALDWLQAKTRMPRVVLLDLNLPGIHGHEVLKAIRSDERLKDLPVIVFSSSTKASDIEESFREGANAFVRKPGNLDGYERLVERLYDYWHPPTETQVDDA